MKFIDSYGLPEPLKRAIEWQREAHSVGSANISCTGLIDSPLIRYLWRVYGDQVEVEYASRLWALFGAIAHSIVERFGNRDESEHVERKVYAQYGTWKVSGLIDLIRSGRNTMDDYKFTSTYAVSDGVKDEWVKQLNVYLGLLRHSDNLADREIGMGVKRLRICAMLRDWGPRLKDRFPVQVAMLNVPMWDSMNNVKEEEVPLWTDVQTTKYIRERVELHRAAEEKQDMPPCCSDEERWIKPDHFKVIKEGRKTSVKNFSLSEHKTQAEAEAAAVNFVQQQKEPEKHQIVLAKSKAVRCEEYCDVAKFCPYQKGNEIKHDEWV